MFSLADLIIAEQVDAVRTALQYGVDVNQVDEYGFTPLIEAAIADNLEISKLLIAVGADVNLTDMLGSTALHWAVENNNLKLAQLLLAQRANPNAYNLMGKPVLVMPLLRQQNKMKKLLLQAGADLSFAQDYINTKLLGHIFELVGVGSIVDEKNNFVEVDFEGFFLEVTLSIIAESLAQFNNHFAARQLRRYIDFTQTIIDTVWRAARLMQYQHYRINVKKYQVEIQTLIQQEPLIIPVGYEGHAITFIKMGNLLVKCDRREDSRLYDNIMIYHMQRAMLLDNELIQKLMYEKQTEGFINHDLPAILGLQPLTEVKIAAQISGNCTWANVEACIPALYFLLFTEINPAQESIARNKKLALNFFTQWREWNKDRALYFCVQRFKDSDQIRKACKAEILAAIFFQTCMSENMTDRARAELVFSTLNNSPYAFVLQNYIKSYCYEDQSEEGKRFLRTLKDFGYIL